MELNHLFGGLLFAVGFDVHTRAGRVWKVGSPPGSDGKANGNDWTGWSHMILIVRLDGQNYFVEVWLRREWTRSSNSVTSLILPQNNIRSTLSKSLIHLAKRFISYAIDEIQIQYGHSYSVRSVYTVLFLRSRDHVLLLSLSSYVAFREQCIMYDGGIVGEKAIHE